VCVFEPTLKQRNMEVWKKSECKQAVQRLCILFRVMNTVSGNHSQTSQSIANNNSNINRAIGEFTFGDIERRAALALVITAKHREAALKSIKQCRTDTHAPSPATPRCLLAHDLPLEWMERLATVDLPLPVAGALEPKQNEKMPTTAILHPVCNRSTKRNGIDAAFQFSPTHLFSHEGNSGCKSSCPRVSLNKIGVSQTKQCHFDQSHDRLAPKRRRVVRILDTTGNHMRGFIKGRWKRERP